jgi:hypothetical protein
MAGLEGTVNVPLAGKQPKKLVVGGVLVVGTATVIYYYRKRKTAAAPAASAATPAGQYPPDGTTGNPQDLYSTDPATGQTYGNEMAGAGAGGSAGGALGSGAASGMFYDPATGAYDLTSPYGTGGTGVSSGNPATPGGPPFANNAAWSNWVIQEIQALNSSVDAGALTDALGVYLEGGQVTQAQKTLVFDALAIAGDPPVAGALGYPPKVRTAPVNNHTTVTVPQLVGDPVAAAESALSALGLKAKANARSGTVTAQSPAAGRRVSDGSTVTLTVKATAKPPPPHKPPGPEQKFTEAQEREAWAPGRPRRELGKLFIHGRWVSGVPRP